MHMPTVERPLLTCMALFVGGVCIARLSFGSPMVIRLRGPTHDAKQVTDYRAQMFAGKASLLVDISQLLMGAA